MMYLFLFPLVLGFAFNLASAFTAAFSRQWGERRGSVVTIILRDILGIPTWAIGFVLAARAPSPILFVSTIVTDVVGWSMIVAGCMIILIALVTIRLKAAMPSTQDALVQTGMYAHVRHPIHTGTFLEFAGLFLLISTQTVALACALGIVWILVQTRLEEFDLLQRLPTYREYMRRVPRFLPRFRTKS
jgi:protein-S-isoprenylcysteine O-methyltransferase Ste14